MGEEEPQPEMETVAITRAFKAAAAVMGFGCKQRWIVYRAGSPFRGALGNLGVRGP